MALRAQRVGQEFDLRALAAAVDSLEGDQPAERPFVDWWLHIHLVCNGNVTQQLPASSLTAVARRRNAARPCCPCCLGLCGKWSLRVSRDH